MESSSAKKSSFVNVIAWLMMGFGGFALLIASFQLFLFLFVLPDEFPEQIINPHSERFIEQFMSFMFTNLPILLGLFMLGNLLQIVVGFGLWKRHKWAWVASMAVFVVILLGTIGGGIFQQIFYSIVFSEMPEVGPEESIFASFQIGVRAFAGFMMLAMSALWIWILYRFLRPEIRREFV
ncbi:MAG: hypothetical protein AAF927_17800 [Bacteroidota bacterium]